MALGAVVRARQALVLVLVLCRLKFKFKSKHKIEHLLVVGRVSLKAWLGLECSQVDLLPSHW